MSGKYRNKFTVYNGVKYASKKEAEFAATLDLRKKAGEITGWRRQSPVVLSVNGKIICKYVLDFVIQHKDSTEEFIEIKGYETQVWKLKWKLFLALLPVNFPNAKATLIK